MKRSLYGTLRSRENNTSKFSNISYRYSISINDIHADTRRLRRGCSFFKFIDVFEFDNRIRPFSRRSKRSKIRFIKNPFLDK